ncbi:MAG: exopolysaccharide biosynthesis polyprenyl glycosylphosphotransferase [Clostridium sp.]|nr:exopolysaccharide biosynthesis polyprenyl glycosylphosphotransferase [Acetatifactor muris]MCM1526742.1 exopolysaccharide biosynthesis polyprenyl glycosylphosphotransferase [Bacteroides sp.]MCM1562798.1 exopolysaccharide biosynthesis polyprenyl glycosylphosphotransferase [Clostridium sp.]
MKANTNEYNLRRMEAFKRLINIALSALCLALETGIFAYHWLVHFQYSVVESLRNFGYKGHIVEIAFYGLILFFLTTMYGGMRLGYLKNVELIFSQLFATVLATMFIYVELSIMAHQPFVPKVFLMMLTEQTITVIIYTNIANRIYRNIFPPRKLLLIHGERPIEDIYNKFESRRDKYIIEKTLCMREGMDRIRQEILHSYEKGECTAVVVWDVPTAERNQILKFCYAQNIRIYIMPKITDVILGGAEELHIFDSPLLLTREYRLSMEQRFIKRTVDIVCSLILLVLTSPIMLLTAIAIKAYDGGPVLYKQIRCTRGRRQFSIMKFRSMRTDAEKDGVARLAQKNDDRITPIGKFIRKCRIDELPQLFNILRGDMSFIGPRPERPEIIRQYMEIMPEFAYRTKVKAGLAGFAQVYGKYNTSPYDKLKLDLTYIEHYSLWLDLKLMLLTLKVLFWPDSTEGVESEMVTAFKKEHERDGFSEQDTDTEKE